MENNYYYVLEPVWVVDPHTKREEIQLWDIWVGKEWCGSRCTFDACKRFMTVKKPDPLEGKPYQDQHIRMRKVYQTFGEKWWYQIFKEMERSTIMNLDGYP